MEEFVSKATGDDTVLMGLISEMKDISNEFQRESPEYVPSPYQ